MIVCACRGQSFKYRGTEESHSFSKCELRLLWKCKSRQMVSVKRGRFDRVMILKFSLFRGWLCKVTSEGTGLPWRCSRILVSKCLLVSPIYLGNPISRSRISRSRDLDQFSAIRDLEIRGSRSRPVEIEFALVILIVEAAWASKSLSLIHYAIIADHLSVAYVRSLIVCCWLQPKPLNE